MERADALIVGGGPGGLASAIAFASSGYSTILLERRRSPPDGPGETFHPGIEPIFEQLGVKDMMTHSATARHPAISVHDRHGRHRQTYGHGWLGFQIRRLTLNLNLIRRLDDLGGDYRLGAKAGKLRAEGCIHIVESDHGIFRARWVVDASGSSDWLGRCLGRRAKVMSQPKWLRFGYRAGTAEDGCEPRLRIDPIQGLNRWSWRAPLGDGETAWVECDGLSMERRHGSERGADGTWLLAEQTALPRLFRVGDAACRLDPTNGHGVLRAMMSAMMAAHLAIAVDAGKIDAGQAALIYNQWISHWFHTDADALQKLTNIAMA